MFERESRRPERPHIPAADTPSADPAHASRSGASPEAAAIPATPIWFDFGSISILPPEPPVGPDGGPLGAALTARIQAKRGDGAPLEPTVQRRMEGAFAHRFDDVRIHADGESDTLNRSLGARAFTLGSDIFLGQEAARSGRYGGDALLAHELTHVVQQQGGQQEAALRVAAAGDPQEQTAAVIAEQAGDGRTVETIPTLSPVPGTGAPVRVQRDPVKGAQDTAATPQPTLASLTRDVAILRKQGQATRLDLEWRAKFGEKMARYRQAIWRITGAIDAAANGFQTAQVAQAQTDQAWAQFEGLAISVIFASGFEWMFRSALGWVGVSAGKIKDTVELVENPANALVGGLATNARTTYIANEDAQQGQVPALGGGGGGAVAFLTSQSEALDKHAGDIEGAFLARTETLDTMKDDAWNSFDVAAQATTYDRLYRELEAAGKGVEALRDGQEIALIIERHLWAAWIQGRHTALIEYVSDLADADAGEVGSKYSQALSNFGSDINERLIAVGIEEKAGTGLYTHWWQANAYGWQEKLMHWAQSYKESVLK
jgi:hypothetical protein